MNTQSFSVSGCLLLLILMRILKMGHISCGLVLTKFITVDLCIHLETWLTGSEESSYAFLNLIVLIS